MRPGEWTLQTSEKLSLSFLTCGVHLLVHVHFLQIDGGRDGIEGLEDVICRGAHFLLLRHYWEGIHAVVQ